MSTGRCCNSKRSNIYAQSCVTYIKNSAGKLIEFREWIPSGNKVKQNTFTYKSLFNNDDIDDIDANDGQLSLFGDIEDADIKASKPVQLTRVYEG